MARNESKATFVWLILTIIMLVAVSVFAFIFYRANDELRKDTATAKEQYRTAKKGMDKANSQVQYLKHMIGWETLTENQLTTLKNELGQGDATWQDIVNNFDKDMETVKSATIPANQLNYRNFFQLVLTTIKNKNFAVADHSTNYAKAIQERKAGIDAAEARAKTAEETATNASRDLAAERGKMKSLVDKADAIASTQTTLATQRQTKLTSESTKWKQVKARLDEQLKGAQDTITNLKENRKKEDDSQNFKIADGKIVWVNQRSNLVWINLGRKHGLRRATTFAVYDRDESGVAKPVRKGAIEVLRIVNDHSAEARVTESSSSNPILPQDKIYTPAWRPGRKVHFAIAGLIDVTGNGKSDRGMVRSLIRQSGGVIDYEIDKDGKVLGKGKMTVNTRYLIVGTAPADIAGSSNAAITGYSDAIKSAQQLGIDRISVDKLLSYMGWTGNSQITGLGARASANYKGKVQGQHRKSMGRNAFSKDVPRPVIPRKDQ